MNAKQNVKSGIEQQLSSIHMSQRVRSAALNDAHIAGLIIDAVEWVCDKFNGRRADVFLKHNVYYWE